MTAERHSAESVRHDEGVRCTSLDGHHRLAREKWGWSCSVCAAILNLGVWYSDPEHIPPSRPSLSDLRDGMTDDEFWAHVYPQGDDGPDTEGPEDFDLLRHFGRPCEICGEVGPCGYDNEGRPMIHTEEEANPDA